MIEPIEFIKFQSLFYWILFLREKFENDARFFVAKFQSLFYWILFLREDRKYYPFSSTLVSILVLLDFVLKEYLTSSINPSSSAFQSLFYWILFLRSWPLIVFHGPLIVSILVLLDFVLKVCYTIDAYGEKVKFQSLFYWILFLRLLLSIWILVGARCFNPCFIGFCS